MKTKLKLVFLFTFCVTVAFAQKKKPLSFGMASHLHFYLIEFELHEIRRGSTLYAPAKTMGFFNPSPNFSMFITKPLSKRLSLKLQTGASMIIREPNFLEYAEKDNQIIIPTYLSVSYKIGNQHNMIRPFVEGEIGYVQERIFLRLNIETSLDRHGGLGYGFKIGFDIHKRKLKKLAPFRFTVGYNAYFENTFLLVDYLNPSLEDVSFWFKTKRASIVYGIEYVFPNKKKDKKKQ